MPYLNRRSPIRKTDGLSELVRLKLETGFWFDFLDGPRLSDAELREAWGLFRDTMLVDYTPPSWCPDLPCWGEFIFDLLPVHGARRGVDPDDKNFGYCWDDRDCEPWRDYYRRCGIKR